MKTLILLFLFSISAFSQNEQKIDSIFNYHFKILKMELGIISPGKLDKNNIYYNEIILDDRQKVYVNKYSGESIIFFENLTKILGPTSKGYSSGYSIKGKLDIKTFNLWEKWYHENLDKIRWNEEKKQIYFEGKKSNK